MQRLRRGVRLVRPGRRIIPESKHIFASLFRVFDSYLVNGFPIHPFRFFVSPILDQSHPQRSKTLEGVGCSRPRGRNWSLKACLAYSSASRGFFSSSRMPARSDLDAGVSGSFASRTRTCVFKVPRMSFSASPWLSTLVKLYCVSRVSVCSFPRKRRRMIRIFRRSVSPSA